MALSPDGKFLYIYGITYWYQLMIISVDDMYSTRKLNPSIRYRFEYTNI
jgi:hypothetical protein